MANPSLQEVKKFLLNALREGNYEAYAEHFGVSIWDVAFPDQQKNEAFILEMLEKMRQLLVLSTAERLGQPPESIEALVQKVEIKPIEPIDEGYAVRCTLKGADTKIVMNGTTFKYLHYMCRLWSGLFILEAGDVNGETRLSLDVVTPYAQSLMEAYSLNRAAFAIDVEPLLLTKKQLQFAAESLYFALFFLMAHEFAHIVIKTRPEQAQDEQVLVSPMFGEVVDGPLAWPRTARVERKTKAEILAAWAKEFAADRLAIDLVSEALKYEDIFSDREERTKAFLFLAPLMTFLSLAMAEDQFYKTIASRTPYISLHPSTTLRLANLRTRTDTPSRVINMDGYLGEQATKILQRLDVPPMGSLKRPADPFASGSAIESGSSDHAGKGPSKQLKEFALQAQDIFDSAMPEYQKKQATLEKKWGFGSEIQWGMSLQKGLLQLGFSDGSVVEADIQAIGSYSPGTGSWEWAWNNPHIPEPIKKEVAAVYKYGKQKGISYLTKGILPISDKTLPIYLSAIASKVMKSPGIYVGEAEDLTYYLSIRNPRKKRA